MGQTARTIVNGIGFNTGANLIKTVVQFAIVIPVLARFLSPDEFGLAGMAVAFIMFFSQFSDFGISTAIVRHPSPSRALWSSALWTKIGLGVCLSGLAFVCAPLIAAFFERPALTAIIKVLSLIILLHCSFLIPMAWLQRALKFKTIAIIDVASVLVSALVAIGAALLGLGVWALVLQQLALYAVKVLATFLCHHAEIAFVYRFSEIKAVLAFSLRLTGAELIGFVHRNLDNVLIGKFLGAAALGFYGRAYTVMLVPVHSLGTSAGFALYPVMAQTLTQPQRLSALYLKALSMLTGLVAPMMVGLALLADPFVSIWLGADWQPVAPLITLLVFVGLMQTLQNVAFTVWKALGRADVLLRWSLAQTLLFSSAFAFGVWTGDIETLAGAYLLANAVIFVPFQWLTCRRLGGNLRALWGEVAPGVICSAVMGGLLLVAAACLPETAADWSRLACLIPLGIGIYFLSWRLLFKRRLHALGEDLRLLRRPEDLKTI